MEPEIFGTRLVMSSVSSKDCLSISSHECCDSESYSSDSSANEIEYRRFQLREAFFTLLENMKINIGEEHEWTIKDELDEGDRKMTRLCRMFIKHKKWPIMVEIVRYCECLKFINFNDP